MLFFFLFMCRVFCGLNRAMAKTVFPGKFSSNTHPYVNTATSVTTVFLLGYISVKFALDITLDNR